MDGSFQTTACDDCTANPSCSCIGVEVQWICIRFPLSHQCNGTQHMHPSVARLCRGTPRNHNTNSCCEAHMNMCAKCEDISIHTCLYNCCCDYNNNPQQLHMKSSDDHRRSQLSIEERPLASACFGCSDYLDQRE